MLNERPASSPGRRGTAPAGFIRRDAGTRLALTETLASQWGSPHSRRSIPPDVARLWCPLRGLAQGPGLLKVEKERPGPGPTPIFCAFAARDPGAGTRVTVGAAPWRFISSAERCRGRRSRK